MQWQGETSATADDDVSYKRRRCLSALCSGFACLRALLSLDDNARKHVSSEASLEYLQTRLEGSETLQRTRPPPPACLLPG